MRVFVTGVSGQLGHDVMNELLTRGHEAIGSDKLEAYHGIDDGTPVVHAPFIQLDITDRDAVHRVMLDVAPEAVVHCAAWTAVDLAEMPENREMVHRVNAEGTRSIAEACARQRCKLIYTSTDYVFNGKGVEPWKPDCRDFAPLNVYGQTKLEGEMAVTENLERYFIVRISWVFGVNGKNFVKTMLKLGKTRREIEVVDDQIGTPTYTFDLARLLIDMLETEKYGFYHVTNEGGYISRAAFTEEILRQAGLHAKVVPVSTERYEMHGATRPINGRLDRSKIVENGFTPLPDWRDALARYLKLVRF